MAELSSWNHPPDEVEEVIRKNEEDEYEFECPVDQLEETLKQIAEALKYNTALSTLYILVPGTWCYNVTLNTGSWRNGPT
jgi:hypothetical protein